MQSSIATARSSNAATTSDGGAELLFQALTEREETNSIASNQPFSG